MGSWPEIFARDFDDEDIFTRDYGVYLIPMYGFIRSSPRPPPCVSDLDPNLLRDLDHRDM
jgi:hypothetical protein